MTMLMAATWFVPIDGSVGNILVNLLLLYWTLYETSDSLTDPVFRMFKVILVGELTCEVSTHRFSCPGHGVTVHPGAL